LPADQDLAEWLEDNAYGTVGTDIFVGFMPDAPDACISVAQSGGAPPPPIGPDEHVTVQIRVRNTAYATARTTVNAILKALHQMTNETIETRTYHRIDALGSPAWMGWDEKNRSEWTINFQIIKNIE